MGYIQSTGSQRVRHESVTSLSQKKGIIIAMTVDFSSEAMEARWRWNAIFSLKCLKEGDCEHRTWYPTKIAVQSEDKLKTFPDKGKLT